MKEKTYFFNTYIFIDIFLSPSERMGLGSKTNSEPEAQLSY